METNDNKSTGDDSQQSNNNTDDNKNTSIKSGTNCTKEGKTKHKSSSPRIEFLTYDGPPVQVT